MMRFFLRIYASSSTSSSDLPRCSFCCAECFCLVSLPCIARARSHLCSDCIARLTARFPRCRALLSIFIPSFRFCTACRVPSVAADGPFRTSPWRSLALLAGSRQQSSTASTCGCSSPGCPSLVRGLPSSFWLRGGTGTLAVVLPHSYCPCLCLAFSASSSDGLYAVDGPGGEPALHCHLLFFEMHIIFVLLTLRS